MQKQTDISKIALDQFKTLLDAQQLARTRFIDGDMEDILEKLAEEGIKVDIVHAHLSLHYFDYETTMRIFGLIRKVLKPDGKLIFKVFSNEDKRLTDGRLRRAEVWDAKKEPNFYEAEDGKPTRLFTREDLNIFLKSNGFAYSDKEVKQITVPGWGRRWFTGNLDQ